MCGALSGGLLLIGALAGRDTPDGDDTAVYALTRAYRERFAAEFGATQCDRLRLTVVHGSGGLSTCTALVEQAVALLFRVVEESQGL
jgi:hypothetical protein